MKHLRQSWCSIVLKQTLLLMKLLFVCFFLSCISGAVWLTDIFLISRSGVSAEGKPVWDSLSQRVPAGNGVKSHWGLLFSTWSTLSSQLHFQVQSNCCRSSETLVPTGVSKRFPARRSITQVSSYCTFIFENMLMWQCKCTGKKIMYCTKICHLEVASIFHSYKVE